MPTPPPPVGGAQIGRSHGRELAVVLLATVLAGLAAALLAPPPDEVSRARAVLRAPADIVNPSVVGVWVDSFGIEMARPATTDAVVATVPGMTPEAYREGVEVSRQGFSVQFEAVLEHEDAEVAGAALRTALDTTVERIATTSVADVTDDVARATERFEEARTEQDTFVDSTGVFDARGTYQATVSDIRALDRQIREGELLGLSSTYLDGLAQARDAAEAELPRLVELAQRSEDLAARVDEARTDLYGAEDRLDDALADNERLRTTDALVQDPVRVTTSDDLLPWAQKIVLAAGAAFVVSLLLLVVLRALLRRRRARRRSVAPGLEPEVDLVREEADPVVVERPRSRDPEAAGATHDGAREEATLRGGR